MLEEKQIDLIIKKVKRNIYFFLTKILLIGVVSIFILNYYEYRTEVKYIALRNSNLLNYTVGLILKNSDATGAQSYLEEVSKFIPEYSTLLMVDNKGNVIASSNTNWIGAKLSQLPKYLVAEDIEYALKEDSHKGIQGHGSILDFTYKTDYGAFMIHYDTLKLFKTFIFYAAVNLLIFVLILLLIIYFLHRKINQYFLNLVNSVKEQFSKYSLVQNLGIETNPYPEMMPKSIMEFLSLFFQNLIEEKKWHFIFLKQFMAPFFLMDKNEKIVFINQAAEELMGKSLEDLRMGTWIDTIEGLERKKVLDIQNELIKQQKSQTCEFSFVTSDNKKTFVKAKLDVIKNVDNEVKGYQYIFEVKS